MRNVLILCAQCRWPFEHFLRLHGNPPATSPSPPRWAHDCGLRDYVSRRLVKGLPGSFCAVTDGWETEAPIYIRRERIEAPFTQSVRENSGTNCTLSKLPSSPLSLSFLLYLCHSPFSSSFSSSVLLYLAFCHLLWTKSLHFLSHLIFFIGFPNSNLNIIFVQMNCRAFKCNTIVYTPK